MIYPSTSTIPPPVQLINPGMNPYFDASFLGKISQVNFEHVHPSTPTENEYINRPINIV